MMLCDNFLIFNNRSVCLNSFPPHNSPNLVVRLNGGRRRLRGLVPNAKKNRHSRKKSWWQRFFFEDDGNWLGLKDEDMLDQYEKEKEEEMTSDDDELSEGEKFEAWKRRAEAIIELREAQEDMRNEENRRWEEWLVDGTNDVNASSWDQDWVRGLGDSVDADPTQMIPNRGLVESVRDLVLGREDNEMLYEDRVFRYASLNSVSTV